MPEFDGPWKEALSALFRHLLRLYRPAEAEQVNWQSGIEPLETEIQKLLPSSQTGVKRIDKLFKVSLHNGEVRYYHVEVQCWKDDDFEYRVYIYNSVAELFCGDPVDSLIVLGDDDPDWLPSGYTWERSCSRKEFTFEPLKLLRWRDKEEELLASDNPFALFILAHNQAWASEGNDDARAESKLNLLLRGCSLKMSAEDEVDRPVLLRLIDWLLPLPKETNAPIWQKIRELREGEPMPFVSWFEEQIEQAGDQAAIKTEIKGLHKGIALGLELKFGADGQTLAAEVAKQADLEWLRRFFDAIRPATSVDDLRKLLP
jgi:hypothetical protein